MIADIVAQDARGHDVLVVVVKGIQLEPRVVAEYFELIERECPSIPFAMLVDPIAIHVKKQGFEQSPDTYRVLDPDRVIPYYDPAGGTQRISRDYRLGLVQAWLDDMIYRWKSPTAPMSDEVAALGLLKRLEKGATYREVALGADAALR